MSYSDVDMVVGEMLDRFPNVWVRALDLQMVRGSDVGIRASIQSISNSLRHAHQMRLIERRPATNRFGHVLAGNTSEWRALSRQSTPLKDDEV